MKHEFYKVLVVSGVMAISQASMAETTLVLDLEQQLNDKVLELRNYANDQSQKERIKDWLTKAQKEMERIKASSGAVRSEAKARYVKHRLKQTDEQLERVGRMYDLNNDLLSVVDRLVSAYEKRGLSNGSPEHRHMIQRKVQQAVHATAQGIATVLDSKLLRPADKKQLMAIMQDMFYTRKSTRVNDKNGMRLDKIREMQVVLEGQVMVLDMTRRRLVKRLQELNDINLDASFRTVTYETDNFMRELGVFGEEYAKEDEELDREHEQLLWGDVDEGIMATDADSSDWNTMVVNMNSELKGLQK